MLVRLHDTKPVLIQLLESIPWKPFRPLFDKGYSQERKSNAGRKGIVSLILLKKLVLQELINLSDEEIEIKSYDRHTFEELDDLGVMNSTLDVTAVVFLKSNSVRQS